MIRSTHLHLLLLLLTPALIQCSSLPNYGDSLDISPFKNWKTLSSDRFRVHFEEGHQEVAKTALQHLEEIHATLSPIFNWEPRNPVDVTLLDNTDSANGLTIAVARIGIVLYLTPPDNTSSLYHWDDWFRLLILHEYVHYLNIDPTTGFMEILRVFFAGDVIRPNGLQPTWIIEGLAVYFETRFTKGGRGRSTYYEMLLRSLVEAKVLDRSKSITLDRLNGNSPIFPLGSTPYFFGYALHQYISKQEAERTLTNDGATVLTSPESAWGEHSIRSSHRIPYFINDNLNNIFGKQWPTFWDEWTEYATVRAEKQLADIQKIPVTRSTLLTQDGFSTQGCEVHPTEQKIAYTRTTLDKWSSLYILDLETGRERIIAPKVGGAKVSYSSDGRYLVYSGLDRHQQFNLYSDLFVYDTKRKRVRKLSGGLRAKDPHFSPDGKWVTFSITRPGEVGVARASISFSDSGAATLGVPEPLFWPGFGSAVYTPKFSPDGRRVVFSLHKNKNASEEIVELDLESRKTQTLYSDQHFNRFPEFDRKGELHFVSDRSGVDNVYRLTGQNSAEAISNVTSGVWLPCFGANAWYGSLFSSKGFDLARFDPKNATSLTKIDPPDAPDYLEIETIAPSESEAALNEGRYRPSGTLFFPRYWSPLFSYSAANNIFLFGANVGGTDALNIHRYDLRIAGYLPLGLPSGYFSYLYRGLGLDLRPHLSFNPTGFYGNDRALNELEAGVELGFTFRWLFSRLRPAFRVYNRSFLWFEKGFSFSKAARSLPVVEGSLRFQTSETSILAITTEGGHATGITSRYFPTLNLPTLETYAFYRAFIRLFGHAVLSPYVSALVSNNRNSFVANSFEFNWAGADFGIGGSTPYSVFSYSLSGFRLSAPFNFSQGYRIGTQFDFPILRIFRGISTHPIFFNQFIGSVHPMLTYIPDGSPSGTRLFPAVRLSLAFQFTLFYSAPASLYGAFIQGIGPEAIPSLELGISSNVFQF